ncbi:MAG TPA: Clp protease N-terminal domain-containing protein [Terracidiphilus sp.]|jgi:ATP-dependent Clp protease ATP-binding subunit ClpC
MFERYTEKARRVIFFGRYEASQFGQPFIETEHLLLGLLREDKALTNRFLRSHGTVESIRRQIEKNVTIGEKISTSVDLPLSNPSKRVLAYAAEEAERFGHKHIGTEHVFLGLLREEGCFAQGILKERGIELEKVREELAKAPTEKSTATGEPGALAVQSLSGLYSDLTRKAAEGELPPIVARNVELEAVIEVLCRKERRNPMLLGESGAGKTAIVEGLAQKIARGEVPKALAEMRVMSLSAGALELLAPNRERFDDLTKLLETVAKSGNLILFVDGLRGPNEATKKIPGEGLIGVLKFAIQEADLQCIGATTEEEYKAICAAYPAFDKVFRSLRVKPLDTATSLQVLQARKSSLEKFHDVLFADEALAGAVEMAESYLKDKILPGKALELLDAAAAAVKVQQNAEPEEILDVRKKLAFIEHRMASAIENHEFEKARFYADEERKERENLAALRVSHGLENSSFPTVNREDVEKIIAKWNAYPYSE